eukprot:3390814-Pleurochrysis_carterae.AAC.1
MSLWPPPPPAPPPPAPPPAAPAPPPLPPSPPPPPRPNGPPPNAPSPKPPPAIASPPASIGCGRRDVTFCRCTGLDRATAKAEPERTAPRAHVVRQGEKELTAPRRDDVLPHASNACARTGI